MTVARAREVPYAEAQASTVDRLVDAGIALVSQGGLRALTVRDVAAMAGISFPAVQYHFPAKADLIDAVLGMIGERHGLILEAVELGEGPCTDGKAAFVETVTAVLSDWCTVHAALTVAAHEMLLAGYRGHDRSGAARRWIERQHAAWTAIVARLWGRPDEDAAWMALELTVGLSVMTLGGGRPIEAGMANAEILRYALNPAVAGKEAGFWYRAFLSAVDRAGTVEPDDAKTEGPAHPAARRILDAGLMIVAEQGSGAVTFRGVAERGGVAVSSITNNFRTRENLLYRIYRWIHDEMAALGASVLPSGRQMPTGSEFERYSGHLRMILEGDAPYFLASYDLVLAATRDARLGEQAWRMRMTRGVYFMVKRGRMPAPPLTLQFRWHIVSLWSIGLGIIHHIRFDKPKARAAAVDRRLKLGLEALPFGFGPSSAQSD
ncbi:MAG TPA: TetR/AcrR family transcriptional regulator [Alphaproteobacteria bacterium]|nr:TetR/AcrR family transcriptional regulator [Alphaproteobacteria bacterium]